MYDIKCLVFCCNVDKPPIVFARAGPEEGVPFVVFNGLAPDAFHSSCWL